MPFSQINAEDNRHLEPIEPEAEAEAEGIH
jgi:hypothetical protein